MLTRDHRYPLTKLLQLYAVRVFASLRPVEETGVVINVVNPGLCNTDLARRVTGERKKQIEDLRNKFGRTAEAGSRTLLYSAVAGTESHGKFTSECRIRE